MAIKIITSLKLFYLMLNILFTIIHENDEKTGPISEKCNKSQNVKLLKSFQTEKPAPRTAYNLGNDQSMTNSYQACQVQVTTPRPGPPTGIAGIANPTTSPFISHTHRLPHLPHRTPTSQTGWETGMIRFQARFLAAAQHPTFHSQWWVSVVVWACAWSHHCHVHHLTYLIVTDRPHLVTWFTSVDTRTRSFMQRPVHLSFGWVKTNMDW